MATVPGASSAAATPGSLLKPGLKAKQATKQQHPDPGAVFAFAVLQGVGRLRQRRDHKSGLNSGGINSGSLAEAEPGSAKGSSSSLYITG